ncbi:MAG: hypothetical protein ACKOEC_08975 [Acidimicrobiia bacterium]
MPRILSRLSIALIVAAPACGGGSAATATPTSPSNVLSVAGTYPTRATVIAERNTCGSVVVQDNPTTVTQSPGATDVSFAHAGSTYRGTVDGSGRFTTSPASFAFPDADYTISLSGRFSTTGFDATVELTKRTPAARCAYAVAWVATKTGGPNTIP